MDPMQLTDYKPGAGDPMSFVTPASELTPRKVKAADFIARQDYVKFLEENPYIEPISIISHGGAIVLTYKAILMFVKIVKSNYWYRNSVGRLAEVIDSSMGYRYMLITSEHNDKLFSEIDGHPYKDGMSANYGDYRGCWVEGTDCVRVGDNNKQAKHLLESDY